MLVGASVPFSPCPLPPVMERLYAPAGAGVRVWPPFWNVSPAPPRGTGPGAQGYGVQQEWPRQGLETLPAQRKG